MITANAPKISLLRVLHDPSYRCLIANKAAKKGLPVAWDKIDLEANHFECDVTDRALTLSLSYVSERIERLAQAAGRSFRLGLGNGRFKLVMTIIRGGKTLLIPNDPELINEIRLWLADTVVNDLLHEYRPTKGLSLKVREDSSRAGFWYLTVPAEFSGTGKRQRLYFATKDLALAERERLRLESRRDDLESDYKTCSERLQVESHVQQVRAIKEEGTASVKKTIQGWLQDLQTNDPDDYRDLCALEIVKEDSEVAELVPQPVGGVEQLSAQKSQMEKKALIMRLQKSFRKAMKKYGIDMKRVGKYKIFRAAAVLAVTFFMCGLVFEGPRIEKRLNQPSIVNADQSLSNMTGKRTDADWEKLEGALLLAKQCEAKDVLIERDSALQFSKQCEAVPTLYKQSETTDNNALTIYALPLWKQCQALLLVSKQCQALHLDSSRLNPFVSPPTPLALC